MLKWIASWPLIRQLLQRSDGCGLEAASARTRAMSNRLRDTRIAKSVCPFCAVGCGQLIHHRDGQLVAIEGDSTSPINNGTLCPKGAASTELLTHPNRIQRVLYRAPKSREWQVMALDDAMDMVADRVWESRRRTFVTERDGKTLNHTAGIAHLGGATLDNEENYLIKKLFTAGLGMVGISNQARL